MADSGLIVSVFKDEGKASAVLADLQEREELHLADLDDAAIVIKHKNGKTKIKQTKEVTPGEGAIGGSLVGLFTGIVTIINPIVVAIIGGVGGVLWGLFNDIGVDDKFMKKVGEHLTPGTSAVFILARPEFNDVIIKELESFGGKIFSTDIPDKAHEELVQKSIEDWNRKLECRHNAA